MRHREIGDDADRCLPVFLYLQRLRRDAAAEAGRLLRVLFLRLGSVPADPGRALGRDGRRFLLSHIAIMANEIVQSSRDWLSSPRTNALAWWIPKAAVVAALFIPRPARTGIWIIALVWMGSPLFGRWRASCLLSTRLSQRRPACVGAPKGTSLRFHDLRHEAVSRLFEKGLNMPEVAAISGHRDARMLMRYTHPKAAAIAVKL